MYDEQSELDAVYCDICGNYHSPSCDEAQWEEDEEN